METKHDWVWGILVRISEAEARALAAGQEITLAGLDPFGSGDRFGGAAVFCQRCQRPYAQAQGQPCFDGRRRDGAKTILLPPSVRE
jgi:hypothetical protein